MVESTWNNIPKLALGPLLCSSSCEKPKGCCALAAAGTEGQKGVPVARCEYQWDEHLQVWPSGISRALESSPQQGAVLHIPQGPAQASHHPPRQLLPGGIHTSPGAQNSC